jgi:hypothetical protein
MTAVVMVFSLVVLVGGSTAIGYLVHHKGPLSQSTSAGIGLLVGLALWITFLVWFIVNGGVAGWRERRGRATYGGRWGSNSG